MMLFSNATKLAIMAADQTTVSIKKTHCNIGIYTQVEIAYSETGVRWVYTDART